MNTVGCPLTRTSPRQSESETLLPHVPPLLFEASPVQSFHRSAAFSQKAISCHPRDPRKPSPPAHTSSPRAPVGPTHRYSTAPCAHGDASVSAEESPLPA